MRVLVILALATTLAGCNGDRIKQSSAPHQAPTQSKLLTALQCYLQPSSRSG
jgi:hypothetical protein